MKKSIVIASLMLLTAAMFAAPKAPAAPASPVKVKIEAATIAENQATMQDQVFNADGSVTYRAFMKYGGGGISFKINGKEGINLADYKTIHVEFTYEACEGWKNPNKTPKFKIVSYGPGATYYNGGKDLCYFDADAASGDMSYDCDISAIKGKSLSIAVPLNSWQWKEDGGSEEDLVKMTIKSITFLP